MGDRRGHPSQSSWSLGWSEPAQARPTSSNAFASGSNMNAGNVISERSTTRLHAPPGGGSSSMAGILGGGSSEPAQPQTFSSNRFASGSNMNAGNVISERPTTRLHAAPGGRSSMADILAGNPEASAEAVSSNKFASGSNMNAGNYISERSTTRLHAAPGGKSSMASILSGGAGADEEEAKTAPVSSNAFASGSNMNAGNFISERSTTRLHAAPGGQSSMADLLSGGAGAGQAEPVSSNKFASGSNMNAGNFISERSTTRLHAAPGGKSSMADLLSGGSSSSSAEPVSSNKFASGANMNAGNFISERSTTRLHAPPGGRSEMAGVFGDMAPSAGPEPVRATGAPPAAREEDTMPIVDKTNVFQQQQQKQDLGLGKKHQSANAFASNSNQNSGNVLTDRPTTRVHAPPGGRSSILFG